MKDKICSWIISLFCLITCAMMIRILTTEPFITAGTMLKIVSEKNAGIAMNRRTFEGKNKN